MAYSPHPDAPKGFNDRLELEPQIKSKFEFVITRNPLDNADLTSTTPASIIGNSLSAAKDIAGVYLDVLITRMYVDSISFPGGISFEYDRVNGNAFVKNVVYPEEVTIEFLEDEKGTVRRYLSEWMGSIAKPALPDSNLGGTGIGSSIVGTLAGGLGVGVPGNINTKEGTYTFEDNQEAAKRTGLLILRKASDPSEFPIPSIDGQPRIMLYGLTFKSNPDYQISHKDGDILTYTVNFSVDEIKIPLII